MVEEWTVEEFPRLMNILCRSTCMWPLYVLILSDKFLVILFLYVQLAHLS